MTHFVDTSGLLALLSAGDRFHQQAYEAWVGWVRGDVPLVTSNYVLVETTALVQSRLGFNAVTALQTDILPVLHVEWVDVTLHQAAAAAAMRMPRCEASRRAAPSNSGMSAG